jgi:hypothetical protein
VSNFPPSFACPDCESIATEMQNAWKSGLEELRARLEDVAISSGRDPRKIGLGWIFSRAEMPNDELQASLGFHYPRVAETRRRKKAHESTTGHSTFEWSLGFNPYKGLAP